VTKGATLDLRRVKSCGECGQRFGLEAMFCPFDGAKLVTAEWDASSDPLVGKLVDGRYQVEGVLGEGGMGKVYRVRHVALDRPFALKALRPDLARERDLAERFIQEAKTTAAVHHPNIVSITDFGQLPDDSPYFVMELLLGQTLADVVQAGGPVPSARAVRIIRQVANALGAAHAAGIVHRDLKPENVFLVGGAADRGVDDVRVVDFGAAKVLGASRLTKTGIVFGTPHYMSPEQASGGSVDHRADIYALGIMMYEMFTGRVPFEADTYMGVLTQHMFVNPVPPSQVTPAARGLGALEQITLRCLEKKPEDRYETTGDLVSAIDGVVAFDRGGRVSIAPRLDGGAPPRQSRVPPRFRMADELEPPTLEEIRAASATVPRVPTSSPWKWIAVVVPSVAIVCAAVVLFALRRPSVSAPVASPPSAQVQAPALPAMPLPSVSSVVVADAPDASPPKVETKRPPVAVAPPKPAPTPIAPAATPKPKCDPDDPFCKH
jgi:serine/threonine-protein kinase